MKISGISKPGRNRRFEPCGKILLVAAWLLLQSCQSLPEADRASMAMGFAEATYGVGIGYRGQHPVTRRQNLVRWDADEVVQLSIKGESADTDLYKYIVDELTRLYRMADIELRHDGGLSKQLLRLSVEDESLLITGDIKTRCYTDYDYVRRGYLRTVDIVIARNAVSDRDDSCLLHEGMHSLGFAGHPHRLNSVLSYTQDETRISNIDQQLIRMLYSNNLEQAAGLEDALTIAYSQFSDFPERRSKNYAPIDISLELEESESPVILATPFMGGASKQFFYEIDKAGSMSLSASYGARSSGKRLAGLYYTRLSGDLIFKEQMSLPEFVKRYEAQLGSLEQKSNGHFDNQIGRFKYIIADSSELSCVFILKYFDASDLDVGGHKVISGSYCGHASSTMQASDAAAYIGAIRLLERDPIEIRERKLISQENVNRNFSALRLTGKWPHDDSPVTGLKLLMQGKISGRVKVTIKGEICEAMLTEIQNDGPGDWMLECEANENASGEFSWNSDGTLGFRGQTSETGADIDWLAYQIF